MLRKTSIILLAGLLLSSCASFIPSGIGSGKTGFEMITVQNLKNLKETEEFTLINVHIPLEGNIAETDAEIPFNDVESYLNLLPENKDEKIFIYCRSGGMGDTAAETLAGLGYTNIWNLEGGYNAWKAAGLPYEE